MINEIMNVNESNPMYAEITKGLDEATDKNLVIVGRSYKNRKNDMIKPLAVKNKIYFYLAYDLDGKTAYPAKFTPEQVEKAKQNMLRRAVMGSMLELMFSPGTPLKEFKPSGDPMNVVTMDNHMYGAGLLFCEEFFVQMEKKFGEFYIIPSSVHELIIAPKQRGTSRDKLTQIVKEVNASVVDENDFLADRAFIRKDWEWK